MTIDWTRKRKLPRFAVVAARRLGILAVVLAAVAALAVDLYFLRNSWNHFALVERAGWIEDYVWLKSLIDHHYPNLDWAVTEGRIDLHRLDTRTSMLLEDASTRADAERALRDFVRAFHDGHLYLKTPEPEKSGQRRRREGVISASTPADEVCKLLEYEQDDDAALDFEFRGAAPFRALVGPSPFAAGILTVDRTRIGLLRLPSFNPDDYAATCISEWPRFRARLSGTCEVGCAMEFHAEMIDRLLDDLAGRIEQLREERAEIIAVDVTGNSGGYQPFRTGAAALLAGRDLPPLSTAVIASEGTVKDLERERLAVARALDLCPGASAARTELESQYWRLDAAITEASIPCDRSRVWSDWGVRPPCSGLVPFQGIDDRTVAEVRSAVNRHTGFSVPRTPPRSRERWHGPLIVLTNRNTGSAAELFAGSLQDHAGATVIGQRTSGSGGGWMLGQEYWGLQQSGLEFYLPDYVAYRRDGTPYQAGVIPNIFASLDWREASSARAASLVKGMRSFMAEPRLNRAGPPDGLGSRSEPRREGEVADRGVEAVP